MADSADTETQELLRKIAGEITGLDSRMRSIARETAAGLDGKIQGIARETADLDGRIRKIVREETADMRTNLTVIKAVQGQQNIMLRTTQAGVNSLKTGYRKQAQELNRLGGLFEDFEHRFAAAAELD